MEESAIRVFLFEEEGSCSEKRAQDEIKEYIYEQNGYNNKGFPLNLCGLERTTGILDKNRGSQKKIKTVEKFSNFILCLVSLIHMELRNGKKKLYPFTKIILVNMCNNCLSSI